MLSKVLRRPHAGEVQTMVFPPVGRDGIERGIGELPRAPAAEDELSNLREKLRQLEARSAAERREAFEAGRAECARQSRAEVDAVVERLNASIAEVLGLRSDLRHRAERDAVELALLIAKRVLHRQLSVDETALAALARVAFDRMARAESYRITVHPRFAEAITAAMPGAQASRVRIEPDPGCALGALIIHAEDGTIDASVDTQLEEIRRGLTDRIEARA